MSLVHLAELALEEGNPSQTVTFATQAIEQFKADKSATDEVWAHALLARSLVAQGEFKAANGALQQAITLSRSSSSASRPLRFEMALASALVEIAGQKHPDARSLASVTKALESAWSEARKLGYLEYEFKLRLALGEIEIKYGNVATGRTHLQGLSREATAKQFVSVARRAAAALATDSSPGSQPPR